MFTRWLLIMLIVALTSAMSVAASEKKRGLALCLLIPIGILAYLLAV